MSTVPVWGCKSGARMSDDAAIVAHSRFQPNTYTTTDQAWQSSVCSAGALFRDDLRDAYHPVVLVMFSGSDIVTSLTYTSAKDSNLKLVSNVGGILTIVTLIWTMTKQHFPDAMTVCFKLCRPNLRKNKGLRTTDSVFASMEIGLLSGDVDDGDSSRITPSMSSH